MPDVAAIPSPDPGAVAALLDAAEGADGARALSEHAELALRPGEARAAVRHVGAFAGGALVAYAQLEPVAGVARAEGAVGVEGVVHPGHRRGGLGGALLGAVVGEAGDREVLAWAHGDHAGAAALARRVGARRVRELLQMRRPLPGELPEPVLPPGVRLRAFRPGVDDDRWLAVNARAFAAHAEQGSWTRADLSARMAEPWFDPAGFLLAQEQGSGELLGFHWTKVHPASPAHPEVGEVYVLGVDPPAQGRRLAGALTVAGLRHLAARGLDEVLLYVEADNTAALRVYGGLGFGVARVDVRYAFSGEAPGREHPPG